MEKWRWWRGGGRTRSGLWMVGGWVGNGRWVVVVQTFLKFCPGIPVAHHACSAPRLLPVASHTRGAPCPSAPRLFGAPPVRIAMAHEGAVRHAYVGIALAHRRVVRHGYSCPLWPHRRTDRRGAPCFGCATAMATYIYSCGARIRGAPRLTNHGTENGGAPRL